MSKLWCVASVIVVEWANVMEIGEVLVCSTMTTETTTPIDSSGNASEMSPQVHFQIVSYWLFSCPHRVRRKLIRNTLLSSVSYCVRLNLQISDWIFRFQIGLRLLSDSFQTVVWKIVKTSDFRLVQIASDWLRLASEWVAVDICRIICPTKIPRKCRPIFLYIFF